MKIIGHPWVESEQFVAAESVDEIKKSPASSIPLFGKLESSVELMHYCQKQGLPFAFETNDLKSMLFVHALGARYIVTGEKEAESFQAVAQHYLFDTEILAVIQDESEIEKYARMGIDGVIFAGSIQKKRRSVNAG